MEKVGRVEKKTEEGRKYMCYFFLGKNSYQTRSVEMKMDIGNEFRIQIGFLLPEFHGEIIPKSAPTGFL